MMIEVNFKKPMTEPDQQPRSLALAVSSSFAL